MAEKSSDGKTNHSSDTLPTETIREMAHRLNPNSQYYEFKNNKRPHFAVFLGAGASVESDISSANKMIEEFIKMICAIKCPGIEKDTEKDKWLKNNCCYKTDKDKYGSLFENCYPKEVDRREYIESQVDGKVPSLGYIALAHLIKSKIIDTVLTTNFDDLVYIACTSYTDIRPVVYSLGGFASEISGTTNRPRVLKLHGDFLFSDIKNTSKELKEQDPNMSQQVRQILESYGGLIVIGYSGNDDSIIELLSSIPKGKYLYWCVYKNEKVSENVEKLIKDKNGWIVRHDGFDKLFNEIRQIVEIKDEAIFQLFEDRRKKLEEEIGKFNPEKFETFKDASDANKAGNDSYNADDLERAEELYKKALELNPIAEYVYFNLGLVYLKKGQLKEAEEFYRKATEIDPSYVNAYFGLGNLLAKDKSRLKEAEEFYKKAIELKPDFTDAYYNLGSLLEKDKSRLKEAEEAYRKATEIDPSYVNAYFGLGNLLAKDESRLKEAEEAYKKAIGLKPDFADAFNGLGNLLAKDESQLKEAEEAYRKAIEIDPNYVHAYHNLGNLLAKDKDRLKEAEEAYRKATEIDPNYVNAYFGLGILLAEDESRLKEAEQAYRKAIELEPSDSGYYNNLGLILERDKSRLLEKDKSRLKEAEKMYQKAIDLSPEGCYFNNLGLLYADQNDNEKALKFIIEGVALDSECPNHLPALAHVYKKLGKSFEMQKTIEEAKNIIKKDDWYHLAMLESIQENKDEALKYLAKAIEEDPSSRFAAKFDNQFDWIRDDPRFQKIVE
ncbi:MAG: tetratricopeptide repeat protein [Acidobacteriota bacterium]|nr:tetratricopeptide repeat protein [Acidobacteriota bacterium]